MSAAAKEPVGDAPPIRLWGVRVHNLRGVDVEIPTGVVCAVTGVSG